MFGHNQRVFREHTLLGWFGCKSKSMCVIYVRFCLFFGPSVARSNARTYSLHLFPFMVCFTFSLTTDFQHSHMILTFFFFFVVKSTYVLTFVRSFVVGTTTH